MINGLLDPGVLGPGNRRIEVPNVGKFYPPHTGGIETRLRDLPAAPKVDFAGLIKELVHADLAALGAAPKPEPILTRA